MTIYVNKPEINVREKLKELDYAHVPYEKMPAGSIIGVSEMATNSTQIGFSTTSFVSTGISTTIHKKHENSKVMVVMSLVAVRKSGDNPPAFEIWRNGSALVRTHFGHFDNGTTAQHTGDATMTYIDETSTDLDVTYTVYARTANTGTTGYVNVGNWGTSTLLALEIK